MKLKQPFQNWPEIESILYNAWLPPSSGDVAEWAENERYLSQESSAEPGKWRNDNAPHCVYPMQCLSPSSTFERVVCKWSSQSGKTELANNFVGFAMDVDPGPILVVQPNVKPMGEAWSKDRLAPMIRDTPALEKVGGIDTNKNRSDNTILHKTFNGGHITVAGANSPAGLASRPIRYLVLDEVDRFETTKEGSPLSLARKRTLTYKSRGMAKELNVSSPTYENDGIDAEYQACDQQHEWHLKCLECKASQMPKFKHFDFEIENNRPLDIGYTCESCGHRHKDRDEQRVKVSGHYVQTKNEGIKTIGFWFNQWASPFATWEGTISEFLESKDDPTKLQSVINTAFCECWEEPGESIDPDSLLARVEEFEHEAPAGVKVITFGVDVQADRIELEVVGWAENETSWSLDYHIIEGDVTQKPVWNELTQLITETYQGPKGKISISAGCIDSGYQAATVYDYVKRLNKRHVWAIKGESGPKRPFIEGRNARALRLRKRTRAGYRPEIIGVDEGKTIIYKRLALMPQVNGKTTYPPGYSHFPKGRDAEYFDQLTAEQVRKRRSKGRLIREFVQIRPRNEALDCRNYAFAALRLLKPNFKAIQSAASDKQTPARRVKPQKGFMNSWRT